MEVYLPLRKQFQHTLLGLLFVILIVALVGFRVAKSLSTPLKDLTTAASRIASGDLEIDLHTDRKDELGQLSTSINGMVQELKTSQDEVQGYISMADHVVADVNRVIENLQQGKITERVSATNASGGFKQLIYGLNACLDTVITPIQNASQILQNYADGDLDHRMDALKGELQQLPDAIHLIRDNLTELAEEAGRLSNAASHGQLDVRGDASRFKGAYGEIISSLNMTFAALSDPIDDVIVCLEAVSSGDLRAQVTNNYEGDLGRMRDACNQAVGQLRNLLKNVDNMVQEVESGSEQVSVTSQGLSEGATEQAAALEEMGSTLAEVAGQTKDNAKNAGTANKLSGEASKVAREGSRQMTLMLEAMVRMQESSSKVTNILKAIDEIAFQTNLLSLNAAVEAARAGVHGKGFAVVADEVRNLAQRSAQAAAETTDLLSDSQEKVKESSDIATETSESLNTILSSIDKVNHLMGDISVSSETQAVALDQVSEAITQIDHVTQQNAASSEEGAASAAELAKSAQNLSKSLKQFQL